MLIPVSLGLLLGFGLWCIARAFLAPVPALDVALASLSEPHWSDTASQPDGFEGVAHRIASWIVEITGADMRSLQADLAVLDRAEERHLIERSKTAMFYGALPGVFWLILLILLARPPVSASLMVVFSVLLGVLGWFLTDAQVRHRADARRAEFSSALATYLGLVSILLAGGAGIQQALHDAVEQGEGWSFRVLRRALTDARVRGISPWITMGEYGSKLEMESLGDLASTMELAGTSGAHIRESLITKAKAFRAHHLADIEREASARTTAMAGPTGLMMTGFVVLLLYPAVDAVLAL